MSISVDATLYKWDSNALVTVAEVDEYATNNPLLNEVSDWNSATDDQKAAAVIQASKIMNALPWARDPLKVSNSPYSPWKIPFSGDYTTGTADSVAVSGSDHKITDGSFADYAYQWPDDYFNGGSIVITESTGNAAGETRRISDYDSSNGIFTVDGFSATPADDVSFVVIWPLKRIYSGEIFDAICIQVIYQVWANGADLSRTQKLVNSGYTAENTERGGRGSIRGMGLKHLIHPMAYDMVVPYLAKSARIGRG